MKNLALAIVLLLPVCLCAQSKTKVAANIQSGYEHNVFRSPASFEEEEGEFVEKDELQTSGAIVKTDLDFNWKIRKDAHRFTFDLGGGMNYYPTATIANLLFWKPRLTYQLKLNKKWSWTSYLDYRQYDRNGDDAAGDFLQLPNAYRQVAFNSGLEWRMSKQNRFRLNGSIGNRIFTPGEEEIEQEFREKSIKLSYRHRTSSKTFQLEGMGEFRQREYLKSQFVPLFGEEFEEEEFSEEEFFEDEEEFDFDLEEDSLAIDIRTRNYFNSSIAGSWKLDEHWQLKTALRYQTRQDLGSIKYSFRQLEPSLQLSWKQDKTKISAKVAYAHRLYPNFDLPDEEGERLVYQYFRASFQLEQQLTEHLFLTANLRGTQRSSNFDLEYSRSYRSYDYFQALMGLKMVW